MRASARENPAPPLSPSLPPHANNLYNWASAYLFPSLPILCGTTLPWFFLRSSFSSGMCHLSFVLGIFVDVAPSGWNSVPSSQPLEPSRALLSFPSQPSSVRERGFYSSNRCRVWLAGGPFTSFQRFCSSKLCSWSHIGLGAPGTWSQNLYSAFSHGTYEDLEFQKLHLCISLVNVYLFCPDWKFYEDKHCVLCSSSCLLRV